LLPTIYVYAWAYRHMCFQYVYILICLLYEVSALEIVITWDYNLIEPKILCFFIESITPLSVPLPSFLNLSRPVFIHTYSLLRLLYVRLCVLQNTISVQL
jgi:hypothetical protein